LDYLGQITKITPEMDDLPSKIAKNELLHETLCRLVENFEIVINPRWPPHDFDIFDLL
jgi:alpha-ketoglutarate-dependent taurine dioxygenase